MKSCPDCAESIQDAARKCRYCGFRFADGTDGDELAGSLDEPAKPRVDEHSSPARRAAPAWAAGTLALGGVATAASGVSFIIANLAESSTIVGASIILMTLGFLLLGVGWSALWPSGRAGFGLVIGCFVAVLALGSGFVIPSVAPEWALLGRYLMFGGMLVVAMTHTFGLESREGTLAKFGAGLALAGIGVFMTSETRAWDLPEGLAMAIGVAGFTGLVLLGLGLASSAARLARA